MADLKLYNNGEGKILLSAGDRIIKQPYEFGKAFVRGTSECYIEIDNLDLTQYYSVFIVSKNYPAWYTNYLFNLQNTNLDNYIFNAQHTGSRYKLFTKNASQNNNHLNFLVYTTSQDNSLIYGVSIRQTDDDLLYAGYYIGGISSTSTQTNEFPIQKIWIGAARLSNGDIYSNLCSGSVMFNRFLFFSRYISNAEYLYLYNNQLLNDPQTRIGLEIDIQLHFAEILNTGGADFVGVRDYSGNNRHGKIMNLPAGTLQEQLDWANANLFVPFTS